MSSVLDYGCRDGSFIGAVARARPDCDCYGADVDEDVLGAARLNHPAADFRAIGEDQKAPFDDASMDAVILLDVLEHVPDEQQTIAELTRVLKPGGVLILSVPHNGIFRWMDTGNLKFRFPRMHRAVYQHVLRDSGEYDRKFGDVSNRLYGDITVSDDMWHRHYSAAQLTRILGDGFRQPQFTYFGVVPPLLASMSYLTERLLKAPHPFRRFSKWDLRIEPGRIGYNVILVATRR